MPRAIDFKYICAETDLELTLIKVKIPRDFELIYKWMQQQHVIASWQLNESVAQLEKYLEEALIKTTQELFLLAVNNQIIGYAEVYLVANDRIVSYYSALDGDYGIHLLIGEVSALGMGYSKLIIRGLSDYLFSKKQALRVLVEPSVMVSQLTVLERRLGFSHLGIAKLPEKMANIYIITAEEFYRANPSQIICDFNQWPLLRLHFPSYPTDSQVALWLEQLNQVLIRNQPFTVVSTFDEHYQFTQEARKLQMHWFKRHKLRLAKNCLAMFRVTNDEVMIKKLTSPAMAKGIPFRCIPCPDLDSALTQANRLL